MKERIDNQMHTDSLYNLVTALGTTGDKATFTSVNTPTTHSRDILSMLYEGDAYAARVVDSLPRDCLKRGVKVLAAPDGDADTPPEPFADWLKENKVLAKLRQAACWARLYGGAALVLGVTDAAKTNQRPLRPGGSLKLLLPVTMHELTPVEYTKSLRDPNYGMPSMYTLKANRGDDNTTSDQLIHYTRVLRFEGFQLSPETTKKAQSWGGSLLNRCCKQIRNLVTVEDALANAVHDINIGVFGIDGLRSMALTESGRERIQQRMLLWNMAKSVANMAVIDKTEESFEWMARNIDGLADAHTVCRMALCAASGIPHTRMFGDSPAGMSTDDHSGKSLWADAVALGHEEVFTEPLRYILDIAMRDPQGPTGGREVKYRVQWPEYLQPSDMDVSAAEKNNAEADAIWVDKRVLTPEQVFHRRMAGTEGVGEVWEAQEVYEEDREIRAKIAAAEGKGAPQPGEERKKAGETEERGPAGALVGEQEETPE
jgi:phage-related protein (TIGR01555 family)